jgi:hypothetical protein
MSSIPSLVLGALLVLGDRPPDPATLPPPPEPLRAGFRAIEEADLRAWLGFLASPELEGRETGQRGYDVAARFAAALFERYGLKPAGDDGTYFQKFDLVLSEPDPEASGLEISDGAGRERLGLGGNLAASSTREIAWSQPWSFAGWGEGADQDAPDDFRGIPLAERVVMVLPRPGRNTLESRGAAAAGARRIAIISDERVKSGIGLGPRERPAFEKEEKPLSGPPEIVYLSKKAADRLFGSRQLTVDGLIARTGRLPRFELQGVEVKLTLKRRSRILPTRNVVGLLEGSDPSRRSEAVALGAHLDHVGIQGGKIHPGADDDGSGSTGILALAKAFSESPRHPARSVLFMLFAGEEKGLWGSRYFVDHPAVPLERITAELQMDMIGRNEEHLPKEKAEDNTNSVHLVGAERQSRELHRTVLRANRFVGLDFEYDEEEVYGRSDQVNFGERGIPVTFFFTGFHADYHRPTDTPDKINYPKMARVLRLVFVAANELADLPGPLHRIRRM